MRYTGMNCYHCHRPLRWVSEHDYEEADFNLNETYITVRLTSLECTHCPCEVHVRWVMGHDPFGEQHTDDSDIDCDSDSDPAVEMATV